MKIEPYQRDFIKMLAKAKIGGHSEQEVVWFLLQFAIFELTKSEYIQKYVESRSLLRRGERDSRS